jgi:tetratricopeptide (TPR) repeat protein
VKFRVGPLTAAAIVALPLAAGAQSGGGTPADISYVPPALVERGSNVTALAGKGDVTVQVFVKKDGSFNVIKVLASSNAGDNAAALEIARSSTYHPALRNGGRVDAYYDYKLAFAGDTAATGTGPVATALSSMHAGKYDQAQSVLQTYLQTHPDDQQAYALLGVADSFAGDAAGAAAAFDKAGTVPDEYQARAVQSYGKYAGALLDQRKFADAIAAAGKAIALDPQNLQGYYVRGIAYANTQNEALAIADLQNAHAIAVDAKVDDKTLATVSFNLAIAQLDAGQFAAASTSAQDVARLDPSRRVALDGFAEAAINNAAIGLANQGKIADAVSGLEAGAAEFPGVAGALLSEAAYIMATDKKPDWAKVRAEAEKGLAIDPNDGRADYVAGVAVARLSDRKTALTYMNKAKASPNYTSDPVLAKQIDDALKALTTAGN